MLDFWAMLRLPDILSGCIIWIVPSQGTTKREGEMLCTPRSTFKIIAQINFDYISAQGWS
ncbi:hypothetical protein LguiA_006328 [Lonicera macranthoides]